MFREAVVKYKIRNVSNPLCSWGKYSINFISCHKRNCILRIGNRIFSIGENLLLDQELISNF